MLLAAVGDTPYNIMLLLHILAFVVALAPAFVGRTINAGTQGNSARSSVYEAIAKNSMRIHGSALVVGGLLGFGVAGMSKDLNDELVYEVKDGWLIAAVVVWIAMNGVLHAMVMPGEKAVAAGDESATGRMLLGSQVLSGLFLVSLYLMIFKPGA